MSNKEIAYIYIFDLCDFKVGVSRFNGAQKNPELIPKCHRTDLNFSCYSRSRGVSTFIRATINQNLLSGQ